MKEPYTLYTTQIPFGNAEIYWYNNEVCLHIGDDGFARTTFRIEDLINESYKMRRAVELLKNIVVDTNSLNELEKANDKSLARLAYDAFDCQNAPILNFVSKGEYEKIKALKFPDNTLDLILEKLSEVLSSKPQQSSTA